MVLFSDGFPSWKPKKKGSTQLTPFIAKGACHHPWLELQDAIAYEITNPNKALWPGNPSELPCICIVCMISPKMGQFNVPWCTYCFYHNHENKNMLSRALFGNISPPWQKKIIKISLGRDMLVHSRVGPWNMSLVSLIVIHFHDCWKRSRWTWWYFTTEFWSGFLAPILIQVAFGVAVRCKLRKSFVKSVWKASENRFVDAL